MNEQTRSFGTGAVDELQRAVDEIESGSGIVVNDRAAGIAGRVRQALKMADHPEAEDIAGDVELSLIRGDRRGAINTITDLIDSISEGGDTVGKAAEQILNGEDPKNVLGQESVDQQKSTFTEQDFNDGLFSEQTVNGLKIVHSIPGALGESINRYFQEISESARQADMDLTSVIMQTQVVGGRIAVTFEVHIRGIDVDLIDEMAELTDTYFEAFDVEITTRSDDRLNFRVT